MAQIVIADVDCYDPSIPGVRTLRFSTQSFVTPAELVKDGDGASVGNWTGSAVTVAALSGNIRLTQIGSGIGGFAYQAITCEIGKTYSIGFTLVADSISSDPYFRVGTTPGGSENFALSITVASSYISSFVATATTHYVSLGHPTTALSGQTSDWDNITVHEGVLTPDVFYDGRIQQPANVKRSCFEDGKTAGRTQISYGDMVLVNNDGGLDALLDYSFCGRKITIKLGVTPVSNSGSTTWTNVFSGVIEQAQFSWGKVTIRVRDRQQDLAKPIQQARYGGTNSLPNGIDGVAGDIKGRPKPMVFGQVFNVSMPCVNTTRLIYQLHDGSALQSVDAVYDRGVLMTAGAAYTSQANMEATAPSAGQYRVWNSGLGTFIRLGSNGTGLITADATQGATAANRTVGQLFSAILNFMGISSLYIATADITALDTLVSYPVGVYAPSDRDVTALELLDDLCNSVGAWYGVDCNGFFRINRIDVPSGTSVGTITATEITQIERVVSRDGGVGIPAWKVKLGYQKIYSTQDDTTANVTAVRKAYLSAEYRRVEASDSSVLTANLTSPEIEFNTLLVNAADASAEVARRLTIYKTRRDVYELTVRVDVALAAIIDLGKVITLQLNRFGLSAGKQFLIIGVRNNMRSYQFDLTVWG